MGLIGQEGELEDRSKSRRGWPLRPVCTAGYEGRGGPGRGVVEDERSHIVLAGVLTSLKLVAVVKGGFVPRTVVLDFRF